MHLLSLPGLVLDLILDFVECLDYAEQPYGSTVAVYSTTPPLSTYVDSNLSAFSLTCRLAHELAVPHLFRRVNLVDRPLHELLYAVQTLIPTHSQYIRQLSICQTIYFVEHPGMDGEDAEIISFLQSDEWGRGSYLVKRFHPHSLPVTFSKERCHAVSLDVELADALGQSLDTYRHVCADDPIQCNMSLRRARSNLIHLALQQCHNLRSIKKIGTRLIQIADVANAPDCEWVLKATEKGFADSLEHYELYDFKWNGFPYRSYIGPHLSKFRNLRRLVLRDHGDSGDMSPRDITNILDTIYSMRRLQHLELQSPHILPLFVEANAAAEPQLLRSISLPRHTCTEAPKVFEWLGRYRRTLEHLELGRGQELVLPSSGAQSTLGFERLRTILDVGGSFALHLLTTRSAPSLERLTIVIKRRIGLAPAQFFRDLLNAVCPLSASEHKGTGTALKRLARIELSVIPPWSNRARQFVQEVEERTNGRVTVRVQVLVSPGGGSSRNPTGATAHATAAEEASTGMELDDGSELVWE